MLGIYSADNATRTARCRRGAAWLLLGWLAFWLTTAAHPFELCFAGELDHHLAVTTPASGDQGSYAEQVPEPASDDTHCPDVSAVTVDAASAATMNVDRLDAVYPASGTLGPVTQPDGELRNLETYFPPPSATPPLYLRTQRLRI